MLEILLYIFKIASLNHGLHVCRDIFVLAYIPPSPFSSLPITRSLPLKIQAYLHLIYTSYHHFVVFLCFDTGRKYIIRPGT